MKNESLIWSVLPPRCVLWIFPTQAGQTWVISFLVLASKIITAKSRNCQFCQFAIIQSVAGLLSRMCWPMRGRDIGRLTNQRPRGWHHSRVWWLNWHHLWEKYFVFETNIIMRCSERRVDAGCCDLDHRQSLWPLILSFVVTHFISLMIPDYCWLITIPVTFLWLCPEIIKLLLNCKKVDYHQILCPGSCDDTGKRQQQDLQ